MKIIIRADASSSIGTGHVMRCVALAQAAVKQGIGVHLIGHIGVPWVKERLAMENIPVTFLEGEAPEKENPLTLLEQLDSEGGADWVVLDGYRFHLDCQVAVRDAGYKLLYIDDYEHLPEYSCDILLNQNIGAEAFLYKGDIGEKLLGEKYTLLHPSFLVARQKAESLCKHNPPRHILISLGGGDSSKYLPEIVQCLQTVDLSKSTITVLQGSMAYEYIEKKFASLACPVKILPVCHDMASLLLETDFCITAGGSTCWELCCLGVPFWVLQIAENQKYVVSYLIRNGISRKFNFKNVAIFFSNSDCECNCKKLFDFIDGKGASRIICWMIVVSLEIKLVCASDCWEIYKIANDPLVRKNAISTKSILKEEHQEWFFKRLQVLPQEPFWSAQVNGSMVGYIRFDKYEEVGVVTIAIAQAWRSCGVGHVLLEKTLKIALDRYFHDVFAFVRKGNIASQKLFKKAGFRVSDIPAFFDVSLNDIIAFNMLRTK